MPPPPSLAGPIGTLDIPDSSTKKRKRVTSTSSTSGSAGLEPVDQGPSSRNGAQDPASKANSAGKASKASKSKARAQVTASTSETAASESEEGSGGGEERGSGSEQTRGNSGGEMAEAAAPAKDEEIPFERVEVEEPSEFVKYLKNVIQPFVEESLNKSGDIDQKLALWTVQQKLEAIREPKKFRIEERSDGTVRLVKVYDWSSPSYDDSLLEELVLTVGEKNFAVTRGCVAFFFIIITGPRWHSMFEEAAQAPELSKWRGKAENLMLPGPLRNVKEQCCYILLGLGPYCGLTLRSGEIRVDEHAELCVSKKMEAARKLLDFAKWKCAASYIPPKDFLKDFAKLLLYFIEHLSITALDATRFGVNCNSFDRAMHEHLITALELAKLVEAVLDDLSPRDESGQRVKRGPVVNEAYFRQKHAELSKIAPLTVGSLFVIFQGTTWQFHTRRLLADLDVEPSIWPSGRLPLRFLATKEERKAARETRRAAKNVDIPGWTAGSKLQHALKAQATAKSAGENGTDEAVKSATAATGIGNATASEPKRDSLGRALKPTKRSKGRDVKPAGSDWLRKIRGG